MRKDWLWPPEESPGPLPLQDRAQKGQVGPSSTPGAASPFTAVTSQYCLGGGGAQPRLPACRLLLSASVSSSIISAKELWLLGLPTRPARLGVQRMDWSPQLAPCANHMRCRPPSRAGLVVRGVDEHKAPGTGPAWHMLKLGKHQLRSALEVLISRTWGGGSEEPQARCPISIPPYPGAHPTWGHQRLVTATQRRLRPEPALRRAPLGHTTDSRLEAPARLCLPTSSRKNVANSLECPSWACKGPPICL